MAKWLILTEKPSAYQNFAKALGGYRGTFDGNEFKLVHSYGHIFELKEPQYQVSKDKVERYASWDDLRAYPWNANDFMWSKKLKAKMNKAFMTIKNASIGKDTIVIATDDDPASGEGDLLAWEIIDATNWHGRVLRCKFADETPKSLKAGLRKLIDVTDKMQYGRYRKSLSRERFDFLSMQLSRIALIEARSNSFSPKTQKLGRLKSTILELIYRQSKKRAEYHRTPYYEVKYKDDHGNVFARKFNEGDKFRFQTKNQAENDLKNYTTSPVVVDETVTKRQEPQDLIDITTIGVILGKMGYKDKQIINTYQKMYETEHWLSYPRPADTKITQASFDELLPLADKIADVVGIDKKLLTHRTARKKYIVEKADHGANRPGTSVPSSLAEVKAKYGDLGVNIYTTVAKAYLAILCEDYVYEAKKAHLKEYPSFTSQITIPKELNYKLVFNTQKKVEKAKDFAQFANPGISEGANPKPVAPSKEFVTKFLKKYQIGTNATILGTLAEISDGDKKLVNIDKKSVYSFTYEGRIQALLCQNTMIASAKITKKLFNGMDAVEKNKLDYLKIPASMATIVKHDMPIMKQNVQLLLHDEQLQELAKKHQDPKSFVKKEKAEGMFNGQKISFNKKWGSHEFSNSEIEQLLAGKEITLPMTSKRGSSYQVKGILAKQTYKGKKFWGFKRTDK